MGNLKGIGYRPHFHALLTNAQESHLSCRNRHSESIQVSQWLDLDDTGIY